MTDPTIASQIGRRAFLKHGTLVLTAAAISASPIFGQGSTPPLKVGLITDLHYSDKPPAGTRYYRESLAKLQEAGAQFQRDKPHFVVELGDLIDSSDSVELEQKSLQTINREFSLIAPDRHYVLGNHCVETLTKEEFLGSVGQAASYYSFDRGGFHFIVLDACFRSDGIPYGRKNSQWTDANIPPVELEWLKADLQATDKQVIVFAHQRLDVNNSHGVRNNAAVRQILESSGKVLAVFQGHSHKNDLNEIQGIHYCTLVAMIEGAGAENNGYSLLTIQPGGTLAITGFRNQKNYNWQHGG